jgi:hypothetical protein
MNYLVNNVRPILGPGISHVEMMNFIQVASLVGLLPYKSVGWAKVDDVNCDAFKVINRFYKQWCLEYPTSNTRKALTERHAVLYFSAAVKWISSNINWNFTHAMAENILTELFSEHRFVDSTGNARPSVNRDILYLYKHRDGKPHPLYRWKTDTRGEATLEVMLPSKDNPSDKVHCIYRTCRMGGRCPEERDHCAYWNHTFITNGFPYATSKYIVGEEYGKILLMT